MCYCSHHESHQIATKNKNLCRNLLVIIAVKFQIIWPSSFRGEDFFKINQWKSRIPSGDHVLSSISTKWGNFIKDLPYHIPGKFQLIWPSSFRGEDYFKIDQWKSRIPSGGHVLSSISTKPENFIEDLPFNIPAKFR